MALGYLWTCTLRTGQLEYIGLFLFRYFRPWQFKKWVMFLNIFTFPYSIDSNARFEATALLTESCQVVLLTQHLFVSPLDGNRACTNPQDTFPNHRFFSNINMFLLSLTILVQSSSIDNKAFTSLLTWQTRNQYHVISIHLMNVLSLFTWSSISLAKWTRTTITKCLTVNFRSGRDENKRGCRKCHCPESLAHIFCQCEANLFFVLGKHNWVELFRKGSIELNTPARVIVDSVCELSSNHKLLRVWPPNWVSWQETILACVYY